MRLFIRTRIQSCVRDVNALFVRNLLELQYVYIVIVLRGEAINYAYSIQA